MTSATKGQLALLTFIVGLTISTVACFPAAAATTTPVTSSATLPKQIAKSTTNAFKPIIIAAVILGGLSILVNEIGRPSRRRKRARGTSRRASPSPRARRAPKPRKQPRSAQQPPSPAPPEPGDRIWGRPAGGSAAARAAELKQESEQWAAGSVGEQQVGRELERLPSRAWWIFHDIPRGPNGSNVDHLVIGVGGVFTVNAKNVSGNVWVAERTLMVNGVSENYYPVSVSEANDVSRRISSANSFAVVARPLLVFVDPPTIKAMPLDVTVLHLGNVVDWISHQPPIYTPEQAYAIVTAADRPTTWA